MVILLCRRNNMRSFLTFLIVCLASGIYSQSGYAVIYKRDDIYFPMTINGEKRVVPVNDNLLVFSDTLSIYHFIEGGNPLKKKKVFGEKLIHHALLYNKNSDSIYSEVNWPSLKNKYLIADTLVKYDWRFSSDTKQILGYTCKSALIITEKNDSVLIWFAPEIKEPFGPANYMGLPGLVLEVYDQRSNLHLFAHKLVRDNFIVVFPSEGEIISKEKYWEINPKKQKGK